MFEFISRFAPPARKSLPAADRQRLRHRSLRMESLDAREMFSVTPVGAISQTALSNIEITQTQQQVDQRMGLPVLDSLPGAPATLYLDFNGNFLSSWTTGGSTFTNVSTPIWDMDGNPNNFSAAEQAVITEVWSRVSEDYAPFNINVSTDYYGTFNNGQALQVAIGGNNSDWLKADASGISSIGSFHDSQPNVVFAFDMIAWAKAGVGDGEGRPMNGPEALADTISHEAGHSFGLFHHSMYDIHGHLADEYDPGSSNWTPIMGNNRADDRTTWAFLPTDQGRDVWQDDMAVIAASNNGFGFRADDHGNRTATADALTRAGTSALITTPLTGSGIINQPNDVDYFKFTAPGGAIQIEVDAAKFGPNLLPNIHLVSASGQVTNANFVSPTRSIINANLPAGGTYYVKVEGLGDYGDVGKYTVTVGTKIAALPTTASVNLASYTAVNSSLYQTLSNGSGTRASVNMGEGAAGTVTNANQEVTPFVSGIAPTGTRVATKAAHVPSTALRLELVDAVHALGLDFRNHF